MAKNKKINWKLKKTWKNALIIGLACITLVGAIIGLSALFRKSEETTKEINPTYAVGGLTEQGAYLETEESIYTEDAFACQGLDVELDFRSNVSYRIYFYDSDNSFIKSTSKQIGNYDETTTPFGATTCRIVITPNDDKEIKWYEKNSYSSQLTITTDIDQTFSENLSGDLFVEKYFNQSASDVKGTFTEFDGRNSSEFINVSKYSTMYVCGDVMPFAYVVYGVDGNSLAIKVIDETMFVDNMLTIDLTEFDNPVDFVLSYNAGNTYTIFGAK